MKNIHEALTLQILNAIKIGNVTLDDRYQKNVFTHQWATYKQWQSMGG